MKTRSGFVSNSSSSSFIVRRQTFKDEISTTPEQEKVLEDFGFRKTTAHSPHQLPDFYDEKAWKQQRKWIRQNDDKGFFNYGYELTCNQDDVISFLIKNRISFVASCHYGHESLVYYGDKDDLYIGRNVGDVMITYGATDDILVDKRPPVVKMSGEKWLKDN